MKVEMPDPATLYASTDINSLAAPFVPGPALYVEPTLNQQVLIATMVVNRNLPFPSQYKNECFQEVSAFDENEGDKDV